MFRLPLRHLQANLKQMRFGFGHRHGVPQDRVWIGFGSVRSNRNYLSHDRSYTLITVPATPPTHHKQADVAFLLG
ncbi:hypothetical protein CKA32_006792 [Geitlerinema sp. FC II]|nr:hypothetical protein CKA32_006792 [Geitlerinema sp. FC II]